MDVKVNRNDLLEDLAKLPDQEVVIIGDVMLDHYLIGNVDRISPEAPVPVVKVDEEMYRLGGAGNVARNIHSLGGRPILFGFRGNDPDGITLDGLLADGGVGSRLIRSDGRNTTRKTRVIAHNQQVVRVDREDARNYAPEQLDELFDPMKERIRPGSIVILSDYGKGLVSEEFMTRLEALASSLDLKVLLDPKSVNYHLYRHPYLLTPNLKEASEGAGMNVQDRTGILRAGHALFKRLACSRLLITLGSDGMALFLSPEEVIHIPTSTRTVFDVTGAGDTVIACLSLGLAAGLEELTACMLANYAAGIVVGKVGAAAATPKDLSSAIQNLPESEIEFWLRPGG